MPALEKASPLNLNHDLEDSLAVRTEPRQSLKHIRDSIRDRQNYYCHLIETPQLQDPNQVILYELPNGFSLTTSDNLDDLWLNRFCSIVRMNELPWENPLRNIGLEGESVLEWWFGTKKLTVYLTQNSAEYIKVWGADIDQEMEDGEANNDQMLLSLWKWLTRE